MSRALFLGIGNDLFRMEILVGLCYRAESMNNPYSFPTFMNHELSTDYPRVNKIVHIVHKYFISTTFFAFIFALQYSDVG